MKGIKRNYTKALADEMDACGVALRESGAYVNRSFNTNELEELKKIARQKIEFDKADSVVVVKGRIRSRGCLARLAHLSKDKKTAKFHTGRIITLHILNGEEFSIKKFADDVKNNTIRKIRKEQSGEEHVGVLYGSLDPRPYYATLVVVEKGSMRFKDIEAKDERSNNRHEFCEILPLNEEDRRQGREIQKALARIAKGHK